MEPVHGQSMSDIASTQDKHPEPSLLLCVFAWLSLRLIPTAWAMKVLESRSSKLISLPVTKLGRLVLASVSMGVLSAVCITISSHTENSALEVVSALTGLAFLFGGIASFALAVSRWVNSGKD